MANYRRGRVNEAVCNEVSQIMRDVKDSRLDGVMITVTGADVTPISSMRRYIIPASGEFDAKGGRARTEKCLGVCEIAACAQVQYAADAGDHVCFRRVGRGAALI